MKIVLDDTQVPQAHTDRSSQHASEPATLEAVGYEWRYAVLYARNDDDDAQLSQRDRAMLYVTEYFGKSLTITQGYSKWHPWAEYV